MKLLQTSIFSLVLLTCIFTACEDNYVIEESETTLSEPIEVESSSITGYVTNSENDAIADALVSVKYNDSIIHLATNKQGNFELELPQDFNRIYLQVEAENYLASPIKSVTLNQSEKAQNLQLLHQQEVEYDGDIYAMTTDSLSLISGQVLLADGTPAIGIAVLVLDISNFSFEYYDVTDDNGNYSFAVKPFANAALFTYTQCAGAEVIAENLTIENEDIDFGVYQSAYEGIVSFTLSGFITDCNTGEGLAFGEVFISFDEGVNTYRVPIEQGIYNVEVENCFNSTCYDIQISSGLYLEPLIFECEAISGALITADYTMCGEQFIPEGNITLEYEGITQVFDIAGAQLDEVSNLWSIAGVSSDFTDNFILIPDGTTVDVHGIEILQLSENNEPILQNYNASGIPFAVEITEIDEYIRGVFSGDVLKPNGDVVELSGSFDIKLGE